MPDHAPCNRIQEQIVAGDALDEPGQAHVLACPSCATVAAEWLALDSTIAAGLDSGPEVPAGFTDRVMAAVVDTPGSSSRFEGWLDRRWLRIVLANLGLAVALSSLLRFVLTTLLPTVSLGARP
jgi:anti-sigma factor RsiW